MPIPEYAEHGLLPPGVHSCTLVELQKRFGRFSKSSHRLELFAKLQQYVQEAQSAKIVSALLVDGSFVTAIEVPNDIDLVAILAEDHDFTQELRPYQSNVLSNRWVRKQFGFDLLVARANSVEYAEYLAFFAQVRGWPERSKGLLRIEL
jgi:hypothetical protein